MDLNKLLQKSHEILPEGEDSVQKNLAGVYEQSRRLNQNIVKPSDPSKGELLLARRGIDVEAYRLGIENVDVMRAFEFQRQRSETDIEGTLKHEHDIIVLTAIEEAKKCTADELFLRFSQTLDSEWEKAKADIFQKSEMNLSAMDLSRNVIMTDAQPSNFVNFPPTSISTTTPMSKRGRSSLEGKMGLYSSLIYQFQKSSDKGDFAYFQKLVDLEKQVDDIRKFEVIESLEVLKFIVEDRPINSKKHQQQQQRLTRQTNETKQGFLIKRSRQYLQEQYVKFVKNVVSHHPSQQTLGDMSKEQSSMTSGDTLNNDGNQEEDTVVVGQLIEKFLDAKFGRNLVSSNAWAKVFYCLRCGYVDTAISIGKKELVNEQFPKAFFDSLKDEATVLQKYDTSVESMDEFNKLVAALVMKTDVSSSKVLEKIEDYIWFKLSVTREDTSAAATGSSLQQLQKKILKAGPNYFLGTSGQQQQSSSAAAGSSRKSLLFFKLLLLTLQFNAAITYLSKDADGYQLEAIHIAIGLYLYGLLTCSKTLDAPLFEETSINFYSLIKHYVDAFAHTDLRDAVSYICLIKESEVKLKLLSDMIIKSKDITTLLGQIYPRKKGCLEELLPKKEFLTLLDETGKEFEKMGSIDVAIQVYFMEEDNLSDDDPIKKNLLVKILNVINGQLSQVLARGENRGDILQLAALVEKRMTTFQEKLEKDDLGNQALSLFSQLSKISKFYDLFNSGNYEDALRWMDSLNLGFLPFDKQKVNGCVQEFKRKDIVIQKAYSELLWTTMFCLYKMSKRSKDLIYKQVPSVLVSFAGLIQSYMNPEDYQRLVKMELLISQ